MKKSSTPKAFALKTKRSRQWLSFVRMVRYGINNFSRNAWLTIAATAVMTITLVVIFATVAARNILNDSLQSINDRVDVSVYIDRDARQNKVQELKAKVERLSTAKQVTYLTAEQVRKEFAQQHKTDSSTLTSLNTATDVFPQLLRIKLKDINKVDQLKKFLNTDSTAQSIMSKTRKNSIEEGNGGEIVRRIGSWVAFAAQAGAVLAAIFVVLSMLIVFNTIRMAIFSRKEEIQMMKLIGADRRFIRGPFIVEATVYGFIAAIFATGLGMLLLMFGGPALQNFGIVVAPTTQYMMTYGVFALLVMIMIGACIGTISSLLATQKYLKN